MSHARRVGSMALVFCIVSLALAGCDGVLGGGDAARSLDAASLPDGSADAGARDAGSADAGARDAAARDAGPALGVRPSMGSGGAFPGVQSRMAGAVPYTIFLPRSYDPSRPLPLLSVFHGQGGSASNMVSFWSDLYQAISSTDQGIDHRFR